MSKILGSWSGMRKYLEQDMLADSLKGRVRYGCTSYIGMDGCHIFEVCIDNVQVKRFSHETVNTYFIENGFKGESKTSGAPGYWENYWFILNKCPLNERYEYTDAEFCVALDIYRNQDIQESIIHDNAIVRMFAILDRRVGKRTLQKIKDRVDDQPQWLRQFYLLRLNAEANNS